MDSLVIVNTGSGGLASRAGRRALLDAMQAAGMEAPIVTVRTGLEIAAAVRSHLGRGCRVVIAAGGDGTVPHGFRARDLVGSAHAALRRWAACGADLLLCGHLHVGDSTTTLDRYGGLGWNVIVAGAGTAISTRGRGAPNSFNVISLEDRGSVTIAKWSWDAGTRMFRGVSDSRFQRTESGWSRAETESR